MKSTIRLTGYWQQRRGMRYFPLALNYVRQFAPAAQTLLDVGGGVTRGCRYLVHLSKIDRTSIELPSRESRSLAGVRVIRDDFSTWQPDRQYDVVLCLQVLEHIPDAEAFAAKLFACATQLVVLSVPYRWSETAHKSHCHDPVDEHKLHTWTHRDPVARRIVDQHPYRRLVAAYPQ